MTEQIWIKHDGTKVYLLDRDQQVVVRFRDGGATSGKARDFDWGIDDCPGDIVEWFPAGSPVGLSPPILLKNAPASAAQPTGVEKQLCDLIAKRQQLGIRKYGTTLADNPAALVERLQHMLEELLDGAAYAMWAINQIKQNGDDLK